MTLNAFIATGLLDTLLLGCKHGLLHRSKWALTACIFDFKSSCVLPSRLSGSELDLFLTRLSLQV